MVDVGVHRRVVAAGKPARQIPAADKISQRLRRRVAALGRRIDRVHDRAQARRLGQLGEQLCRDEALGADQCARICRSAVHAGPVGDHVDHHRPRRRRRPGRARRLPAATLQPLGSGRQGPQWVGTALVAGTRVIYTYRGGQRIQPRIKRHGIAGDHPAADFGKTVAAAPDREFPLGLPLPDAPHGITIRTRDDPVDIGGQARACHRRPSARLHGKLGVHGGHYLGIFDQLGAIHHRLEHRVADVAGQ
ncbi:hypothetical protein LAUMK35_00719 [Mycobacterium pseudokansasii]|nr:hypothetical protein LAUMK35_00719 [Mycobacterium pseudokansasii]VAZ89417.1 hypothetical protein LAUMK21_00717 [Mycobacterium pseudokansasii]